MYRIEHKLQNSAKLVGLIVNMKKVRERATNSFQVPLVQNKTKNCRSTDYTCTQGRLTSLHPHKWEKGQEKTLFTQEREQDKDIIQRET